LGDSLMLYTVQWFSADELSTDTPPDSSCLSFAGSLVVRSGENPRPVVAAIGRAEQELGRRGTLVPGLVGLMWIGEFQFQR